MAPKATTSGLPPGPRPLADFNGDGKPTSADGPYLGNGDAEKAPGADGGAANGDGR